MKTEKIIFASVLTFLFGGALCIALSFPPGARLSPLTVIIPCTVIMLFILVDETRKPSSTNDEVKISRSLSLPTKVVRQREAAIVGWILFLIGLIYVIGFIYAIPLFMLIMLRFRGKESWTLSIFITAGVSVFIYFFFVSLLKVNLYQGLWAS